MLKVLLLSVSLCLVVSSKESRLKRICVSVLCIFTCECGRCGRAVAICGKVLVPGVGHELILVTLKVFKRNLNTKLFIIQD